MKEIQLITSSIVVILIFCAESQVHHADVIDIPLKKNRLESSHQKQLKLISSRHHNRSQDQHTLLHQQKQNQGYLYKSLRIRSENSLVQQNDQFTRVQERPKKAYRRRLRRQVQTSKYSNNPFLAAAAAKRATTAKPFIITSKTTLSSKGKNQVTTLALGPNGPTSVPTNSIEMSSSERIMEIIKKMPSKNKLSIETNESNQNPNPDNGAVAIAFSSSYNSVSHSSTSTSTTITTSGGMVEGVNDYFGKNIWLAPHRPQMNHYRNFAEIFNQIDRKAEANYNTTVEDDEMNDDFNGRSIVAPGQYPHMTALGYRKSTGDTEFKCGGSLISESFVLTAAHCCFLNGQAPHLVQIGDIKLKENENHLIPQRRGIARVIKHPFYNESLYYNDIGLLELTNPIIYTFFVRPIRLWAQDEIPYNKVFTMGYGSTSFAQAPTNVLTELDLSIVPLEICNKTMPPGPHAPFGIVDSQICAKDFEKNRDTCQGDSGGPLQLSLERSTSRHLRYYLVGIISYGTFCRSEHPGVYTRVSSYIDWIASEVWPGLFKKFH